MHPRTPHVQIGRRQRAAMAGLAAQLAAAFAVAALAAVASASSPTSAATGSSASSSSYYAALENRLPAGAGMELVCRALGGLFVTEWSVLPRGRVPRDGKRILELLVDAERYAWVSCSWAYEGNYLGAIRLLDSRWPEAKRCQDVAAGGGMCRLVFEDDAVRLETPGGGPVRVIGDLPVKRCRRHWLLFSTECTYPDHPHPYAGRLLGNAFEFFGV
ncbi:uncharacterized protein LOC124654299 [Lolium rigidum]|uniref:uncharacterized protein LOC124654299 n=1 Tax=Lolium rigidum TaxID=89674 RepID=UPI001F5CD907|nr:uncharacterized protein LOC124654299 [Lolium rigidum]